MISNTMLECQLSNYALFYRVFGKIKDFIQVKALNFAYFTVEQKCRIYVVSGRR